MLCVHLIVQLMTVFLAHQNLIGTYSVHKRDDLVEEIGTACIVAISRDDTVSV